MFEIKSGVEWTKIVNSLFVAMFNFSWELGLLFKIRYNV